jgi:hypothetical protein
MGLQISKIEELQMAEPKESEEPKETKDTKEPKETTKILVTCSICVESNSKQSEITCNFCQKKACRKCTQRYLLEASNSHCMFCRKSWNREFLYSQPFTKSFLNLDLKRHKEDILLDHHKSLLPETQAQIENEIKLRKMREQVTIESDKHSNLYFAIARDIKQKLRIEKERLEALSRPALDLSLQNLQILRVELEHLEQGKEQKQKREFVRNCVNQECKGFLSTRWICGLCSTKVCPACHEKYTGDIKAHSCDSKIVENVKAMEKNTKQCPKCAALIYRVEGCDQMWCTVCKTPWSWKTGNVILTGAIHNPHFYEWQRQNKNNGSDNKLIARQPGDMQCGGMPSMKDILFILETSYNNGLLSQSDYSVVYTFFDKVHRGLVHNTDHIRHMLQRRDRDQDDAFIKIRKNYLLNGMSTIVFKQKLQQIDKKREKVRGIEQIVEMFCVAATDILHKMIYPMTVHKTNVKGYRNEQLTEFMNELTTLKTYTINQFDKFAKCFNDCVIPKFTDWTLQYS